MAKTTTILATGLARAGRWIGRYALTGSKWLFGKVRRFGWREWSAVTLISFVLLLMGLAPAQHPPPRTGDLCAIFDHNPRWYDYARASEERWGTPIPIQMAFVRQESSFRYNARPPRNRLWGFIHWERPSSAYGFAQIQDPVWGEYTAEHGGLFSRRTHMKYALDFVGWYNHNTYQRLGTPKTDAYRLYLAYHQGHTGYRRGDWQENERVLRATERVVRTAAQYQEQLGRCEARFQCRRFWQVGPLCDT